MIKGVGASLGRADSRLVESQRDKGQEERGKRAEWSGGSVSWEKEDKWLVSEPLTENKTQNAKNRVNTTPGRDKAKEVTR